MVNGSISEEFETAKYITMQFDSENVSLSAIPKKGRWVWKGM